MNRVQARTEPAVDGTSWQYDWINAFQEAWLCHGFANARNQAVAIGLTLDRNGTELHGAVGGLNARRRDAAPCATNHATGKRVSADATASNGERQERHGRVLNPVVQSARPRRGHGNEGQEADIDAGPNSRTESLVIHESRLGAK